MFTITGVASFDYFASIGIWFLIYLTPLLLCLSVLTKKIL